MNELIPIIRKHIIKAVTIGWCLGCLCIAIPLYLTFLVLSVTTDASFTFDPIQIPLFLLALAIQGLFIGLTVRIGLGVYQFTTRRYREPALSADA